MTAATETLKVSSRSRAKSVAGALSTVVERDGHVVLQAIGAGAVNQAVKAIAIARGYLAPKALDLVTSIGFTTMTIEGNEKSAIRFVVEAKVLASPGAHGEDQRDDEAAEEPPGAQAGG